MASERSFLNAVKWAYAASWGERGFAAVFAFILAALLGPQDFGVITIAMVYIQFLALFLDQGYMAAIIQRKDLEPEHLDAVFWLDVALSGVLVALSVLLSGWWAGRNHAPELGPVITVLSVSIPIQALAGVQSAILRREMDFRSFSVLSNVSVVVSGVVGVAMAFAGFRVWSLVSQQILRDITALVMLWRFSPWTPKFEFSWKHLKDLTGFSISNFIAQLGIFAEMQASSLLLGLLFGPIAVGLYRLADRLSNSVVMMATSSIQAVSLPEFARHQDRPENLRRSTITCIRLSATVTLPALCGMAAVSPALMATLGPKWMPASDALRVLCFLGIGMVFSSFTGPLLQAVSKPHQLALLEWARTVVGVVILIATGLAVRSSSIAWQIMGIALARTVTMCCFVMPVFLFILMRLSGMTLRDLRLVLMPSLCSSLGAVGAVGLFHFSGYLAGGRPIILLFAETFVGGVAAVITLLALDRQLRDFAVSLGHRVSRLPALARGA